MNNEEGRIDIKNSEKLRQLTAAAQSGADLIREILSLLQLGGTDGIAQNGNDLFRLSKVDLLDGGPEF
jgi:hypothetical protein